MSFTTKIMLPLTILLLALTWQPIMSLPQGAPETVCDTMLPFHAGGILPQNSLAPFRIETSSSVIGQGQTMRVDIVGVPSGLQFGGFMIQARNRNPPHEIIGQFNPVDARSKLMNCDNLVNNSATHSNAGPKTDVSLEWQSPIDFFGQVVFNSTIAQTYDSFWVGVESEPIQVVRRDAGSPFSTFRSANQFYSDCGRGKTCFGIPNGCLRDMSCQSISSVKVQGNSFDFELQSGYNSPAYVALGLSEDDRMGDDLVIECVNQNGRINMYSSYTSGPPNYGVTRLGVPQNTARLLNSSFVDGVIYCKVQREAITNVQGRLFDLMNSKYHLLLASGSSLKENGAGYHDIGRTASQSPISLSGTATGPTRVPYIPQAEPASTTTKPFDSFYNDCGRSKTCFGFPDGCLKDMSCKSISAVKVRGDIYEFELKSGFDSPAYVALGLSEDDKMGDDLVIECVNQNGRVNMYSSYTSGAPNYGVTRVGVPQNTARMVDSSLIDGVIYCKVQRDPVTNVQGKMFDLINRKYNLLLASGKTLKENGAGYHDIGRIPSSSPISLSVVQDLQGSSTLLLRLHGAFMIVAWIGTTSLGILLARYFKQTWVGSQTCGKDQWFAWHRICMVTTWSLTIAAFIIIFVEIGAWSAERNPHAILGLITTILCFIQPIGALFRPAPTSKNRPIFNWAHWLGGNLAHILAIVTIFFSVKLAKAELPEWMDWILVAYVVFHVLVHLIYSIICCSADKKQSQRVNTFQMGEMDRHHRNGMKIERKMDAPYASFRKGLLAVYIIVLILFVIALVLIVVLAPIEETFKSVKSKLNE